MKEAILELAQAVNRLADAVQLVKEGKEEHSPHTPHKKKGKKPTTTTTTRARARFVKPSVGEVAAYIREKGYTFDAEKFWNYYESKGWKIGKSNMVSWHSACATWQLHENESAPATESEPEEHDEAKEFLRRCMEKQDEARKEAAI
jgi:hypothetical protein